MRLQLGYIVHLHEDRHAKRLSTASRSFICASARGCDEQDAIGAHRARLVHLVWIEDEVLAQPGKRAGSPRGSRCSAALEELTIREHGKTGRAAGW